MTISLSVVLIIVGLVLLIVPTQTTMQRPGPVVCTVLGVICLVVGVFLLLPVVAVR